jgi:DNA-binding NtrC family response regulator
MGPSLTPRPKILIVDDNVDDLRWLGATLEGQGYDADTCGSYHEGAERAAVAHYDFVVVSQGGPQFEGQEVLRRATELDRHTPVLVVTRCIEMRCYLEAMQLGALDYLEMPVPAPFLLREIETHVHSLAA